MDGTLTHAVHDFEEMRMALGLPPGQPILESIAARSPEEAEKLHRHLYEIEHLLATNAIAQPGARSLLSRLQLDGRRIGILTRNSEALAHITLQAAGLSEFFEDAFIIGRERCAPKPDPAGINLLMELWSSTPDDTVMIGDYLFDLQAGRSAGTMTIHFDSQGSFQWPEESDLNVCDLEKLATHLDKGSS